MGLDPAARNAALASSKLSATPPFGPGVARHAIARGPCCGPWDAADWNLENYAGADIMTEEYLSQRLKGLARAFTMGTNVMNRRTMIALPISALASMATIGKPARAQQTQRFIVQNNYWALPGKAEEVFQWRIHASDVRERLGLPRGQVLRRQGNSEILPDVIWKMEYQSEAERLADTKVTDVPEFREVQRHMNTLIRRFERIVWRPN